MNFSDRLWKSTEDIYGAILKHPFIGGMADGSLPLSTFQDYIMQDTLYLGEFSRVLAVTGAKAPKDEYAAEFFSSARNILLVKRVNLHEFLIRQWGLTMAKVRSREMNSANTAYTNHLLRTAYDRPFHEALGALLPCFWIYRSVGMEIVRRKSPDSPYSRWIDLYSSEDFKSVVGKMITITDEHSKTLTEEERRAAMRRFRLSAIYEYLFWDVPYRKSEWPFPTARGPK